MRKSAVTRATSHDITILVHDKRWRGLRPTVIRAVEAVLRREKIKKASLTLVLANDKEVKDLNKTYRGKNKPTNVLAFPNREFIGGMGELGDVILSFETLTKEADEQGKAMKHHLTHLTIHGVLHLLGHDHMEPKAAKRMEAIEIATLARMGIANPYECA